MTRVLHNHVKTSGDVRRCLSRLESFSGGVMRAIVTAGLVAAVMALAACTDEPEPRFEVHHAQRIVEGLGRGCRPDQYLRNRVVGHQHRQHRRVRVAGCPGQGTVDSDGHRGPRGFLGGRCRPSQPTSPGPIVPDRPDESPGEYSPPANCKQ